jgi:hypothetical protein
VPIFGFDVYRAFIQANAWAARYLPNAFPLLDVSLPRSPLGSSDSAAVRALTRVPPFNWIERAERKRKFAADRRDAGVDMETRLREGSSDRHSPTRSLFALAELRYRLEFLGLTDNPIYLELAPSASRLAHELSDHSVLTAVR